MTDALDKQQELIDTINGLFTFEIDSYSNNGNGTVTFTTTKDHNFVAGDHIVLYKTIGVDLNITEYALSNTKLEEYEVLSTTADTFTITITYKADSGTIYAKSVYVFNNDQIDIKSKEYPVVILECDDTNRLLNAANEFIPQETEYTLTVLDSIIHHTKGRNTRVKECRAFCEEKMELIMNTLKVRIISDQLRRGEFPWGSDELSFVDVRFEY